MTDWGDYTPGPWHTDVDGCCVFAESEDRRICNLSSATVEQDRIDARLISKAYLIPRLENVLDFLIENADNWAYDEDEEGLVHDAKTVLAELRSES